MDPEDIKPDWKDFLALIIATYQLVLVPVLLIVALAALAVVGLGLFLR